MSEWAGQLDVPRPGAWEGGLAFLRLGRDLPPCRRQRQCRHRRLVGEQTSSSSSSSSLPEGVEPGTVDIAVMIFVMSALHPLEWQRAVANAYKVRRC